MFRLLICSVFLLVGCETAVKDSDSMSDNDPLYLLLADAKQDTGEAYRILAETQNAIATQSLSEHERELAFSRATTVPDGFDKEVTLEGWYGPLDSLAYQIGFWTNYKVEIFRTPVDVPMIRINAKDTPVFEIYQQIRIQAGDRALVTAEKGVLRVVYPELGG